MAKCYPHFDRTERVWMVWNDKFPTFSLALEFCKTLEGEN